VVVDGKMHAKLEEVYHEGKRPLARYRRRWMYDIKMDIEELGCKDVL
jgi:hypothetical protein